MRRAIELPLPPASEACDDPNCGCHRRRRRERDKGCVLGKPILMVIPPTGTHITCPVHGKHWIEGSGISFSAA